MSDRQSRATKADAEAAVWHTRLGGRSVTTAELQGFYDWRTDPANAEAYRKVESLWVKTKALEGQPDIQSAVAEAMARKRRPSGRIVWIGAIAATTGLAMAVAGSALWLGSRNAYSTDTGETRVVQLADGSMVQLDTASSIKVAFSRGERLVTLEDGRAHFDVSHDTRRPFVVRSGETQVRAVGTVFDVQRSGAVVTVSMVSGLVEVTGAEIPAATPQRLSGGQQARISPEGRQVLSVNATETTSWTEGRLVFRDKPLGQAVTEVNRYLTHKVVLGRGAPDAVLVSGVFRAGDRAAFVSATTALFDLTAQSEPDGAVRLTADKK